MKSAVRIACAGTVLLCSMMVMGIAQQPGEVTRGGQNLYRTQDAHDTDQDRRLLDLEEWKRTETAMIQDIRDKQTYTMGGIAGFGAIFVFLQIWQMRKMK